MFDSGVGGLSVLREIRAALPQTRVIYVADSAHIPYGAKSAEFIQARSVRIGEFLISRGAQVLVVACNTATAAAIHVLRMRFAIPVVGMEPGVKPGIAASRRGAIGVLATEGTLTSQKFASLLRRHGSGAEVAVEACRGWVEQVERGEVDSLHTRALVRRHVEPLLARGVDTLVLGCTHYAFLAPLIREVAGPAVTLIDTGAAVAREVQRKASACAAGDASEEFWCSGDATAVSATASRLMQRHLRVKSLSSEFC